MKNADRPAAPMSNDAYYEVAGKLHAREWVGQGSGLTKREHFAGLAMQGLLSNEKLMGVIFKEDGSVAEVAILAADQLLKALEETK